MCVFVYIVQLFLFHLEKRYSQICPADSKHNFIYIRFGYVVFTTLQYSDMLKRLFIKQNQKIPLNFKLSGSIPIDSYIRAMTIFKTPGMIREIVTTCPKHKADIASQSNAFCSHCIL